jgi:multicomponent K+:H+ antiporter subunit D
MNHWMIFPILIPLTLAGLTILTSRFDLVLARVFSVSATVMMLGVSLVLYQQAAGGEVHYYELGKWPAEFGIALILDRLSAMMLVLSAILGFAVSLAAMDGRDMQGRNFHSIFLMQLAGVNCAFLAGDLFNLFVAFEVMLIASYGLMVHGGGKGRLRAGIQFVVINLCGSSVFLVGLGLVYAASGGLNMADIGSRIPEIAVGNLAMLGVGLSMLMVVFALKAALFPFHFWLPSAYGFAPPLVAALFAITTKVGIHSIIRVQSTILGPNSEILSPWITSWVVPAGLITIAIGMIGALGSRRLGQMAGYATLASSGTILVALGFFQQAGFSSGMYYLIHSTLAGAAIFLLVDAVSVRRGRLTDQLTVASPMSQVGLLGGLYLVAAAAMAGLPPFSGFIGKVYILMSSQNSQLAPGIWGVILSGSLLGIFAFARAGSTLFWKSATIAESQPNYGSEDDRNEDQHQDQHQRKALERDLQSQRPPATVMTVIAIGFLILMLVGLTIGARAVIESLDLISQQLQWRG